MPGLDQLLADLNGILWHESVLYVILGTGIMFTIWSGFCQYRAVTHGVRVIRGEYDDPADPGAINHFQALSAALSATVGLGNIAGVALAISLGGPGAVFWMWIVGLFGMAIKLTEVSLSMLYRNTADPENPHGGPMWVASKGIERLKPSLAGAGKVLGGIFCVTLLVSTITGGNMFQAWNVGDITEEYFGIPSILTGVVLAIIVASVIIGGIKRIGSVAGRLVPIMVSLYLLCGIYVLAINVEKIPGIFVLIVGAAFSEAEATGAFIGGTAYFAFLFGMKRAIFSNEAGQGSSPIAHSAAKTDEPVREGIVAGLEPFIDTIVVCTFTALVILSTGIWNRSADASYILPPKLVQTELGAWSMETREAPKRNDGEWQVGEDVFAIVSAHHNPQSGNTLHKVSGTVVEQNGTVVIEWGTLKSPETPELQSMAVYSIYNGATLTAKAFDTVAPDLGKWLVTLAAWLFAVSTMISWAYYGEQGIVYLLGERSVLAYKLIFCALIIVATMDFITTDAQLDNFTGVGTGVMVLANLPIMWLFGRQAMRAYHNYIDRLKAGKMGPDHPPPPLEDLISGRDVEK